MTDRSEKYALLKETMRMVEQQNGGRHPGAAPQAARPTSATPAASQQGARQSDLRIEHEDVLVEIPRGDSGDVLRVAFTGASTPDGKRISWHSIREYYRAPDGTMKPGKKGITIRGRELVAVADALGRAAQGGSRP